MSIINLKTFSVRQIIGFCALIFCLYGVTQLVSTFLRTTQTKLEPPDIIDPISAYLEEEIIHSYFPQSDEVVKHDSSYQSSLQQQVQKEMEIFINTKRSNNKSSEQLLRELVRDSCVCLFYERTYQRILGSHIKLMEYLEFHLGHCFSEKKIYEIFEKTVLPSDRNMVFFKKWLKYLERSYFIQEQEGKIRLTKSGLDFLNYIRKQGYSLYRAG